MKLSLQIFNYMFILWVEANKPLAIGKYKKQTNKHTLKKKQKNVLFSEDKIKSKHHWLSRGGIYLHSCYN